MEDVRHEQILTAENLAKGQAIIQDALQTETQQTKRFLSISIPFALIALAVSLLTYEVVFRASKHVCHRMIWQCPAPISSVISHFFVLVNSRL